MGNRRSNQICRAKKFYNCFFVFIKIVHLPFDEMTFLQNGLKNQANFDKIDQTWDKYRTNRPVLLFIKCGLFLIRFVITSYWQKGSWISLLIFLSIILNPCHEIDSESCLKIHRQVALLMTVADFLPGSPLLTGLLRYFLMMLSLLRSEQLLQWHYYCY